MFPALVLAVMMFASGSSALAPAQQPQDANPSPEQQQVSTNSAGPEKPATKPRKIYTNDDMKGSGEDYSGSMPPGMDQINDCNTNCFEQIRAYSQIDTNANPNWRHDALSAVELVRSDAEWQRFLRDFYSAQYRLCLLNSDRRVDMARTSDPHNVTPQEIAVAEKYDVKQKQVQAELQALRNRQTVLRGQLAEPLMGETHDYCSIIIIKQREPCQPKSLR